MSENPFDQFDAPAAAPVAAVAPPPTPDVQAPTGQAPNPFDVFDSGVSHHTVAGPSGSFGTDLKNRLGTAAVDATMGLIGPIIGHTDKIGQLQGQLTGVKPDPAPQTYDAARDQMFNSTGATEYQPQTTAGRVGQAALTGAMGGVLNPTTIPTMAAGGGASEFAKELFPNHPTIAAIAGWMAGAHGAKALANAPLPAAGGGLDQETAQLAKTATQDHGIPLSSGQLTSNPLIRYYYSETGKMPFSGAASYGEGQQSAFNKAVANTFGEDADKITPQVLQQAKTRIGGMFNDVAQRTSVPMTNDFMDGLQNVVNNAKLTMSADSVKPVENSAMNVLNTAANNGGNIGGKAYIDLTSKGGPLDNMMQSGDSGIRQAGQQIRSTLDDALQQNATPEDLQTLQQARTQYKAMKTVEPLTLRADSVNGATPSTGEISPAALRGAVNQSYQNAAFAPIGQIPLNDLAKIGQRFLKEPPDSGTATRSLVQHGAGALGALAGMEGAEHLGLSLPYAAATVGGTALANRIARGMMNSTYASNRAINGSLNPDGFRFGIPAPLQALPQVTQPQLPWAPATPPNSGQQ